MLAFVHGLHRFVLTPVDHPGGKTWMRITVCYRRIEGDFPRLGHSGTSIDSQDTLAFSVRTGVRSMNQTYLYSMA